MCAPQPSRSGAARALRRHGAGAGCRACSDTPGVTVMQRGFSADCQRAAVAQRLLRPLCRRLANRRGRGSVEVRPAAALPPLWATRDVQVSYQRPWTTTAFASATRRRPPTRRRDLTVDRAEKSRSPISRSSVQTDAADGRWQGSRGQLRSCALARRNRVRRGPRPGCQTRPAICPMAPATHGAKPAIAEAVLTLVKAPA